MRLLTHCSRQGLSAYGLAVFLLLSGCGSRRAAPPASGAAVDAEVRKALERFNDLSGGGNLAAFMGQFDDEADILMVGSGKGQVFKGHAAVEAWLVNVLPQMRIHFEMERVEISHHGDTAWAFVEGKEVVRDGSGKVVGNDPYRFTAILVRRGDGWAWRLFHGSTPEKE